MCLLVQTVVNVYSSDDECCLIVKSLVNIVIIGVTSLHELGRKPLNNIVAFNYPCFTVVSMYWFTQ